MKFFQTYVKRDKMKEENKKIYRKFADECKKHNMFPVNFLKYFTGKSFILEGYQIKKQQIKAIGEAIKQKPLDMVILKNNLLTDETCSYFLNFLLRTGLKRLSL